MEAIEVKNAEILTAQEKRVANKLLNEYYPRIQRQLKNMTSLKLNVKEYKREGKKRKYSMKLEVISPARKFESNSHDWDFARTLHIVLNKVMNEIEHSLHSSDQHPKKMRDLKLKKV